MQASAKHNFTFNNLTILVDILQYLVLLVLLEYIFFFVKYIFWLFWGQLEERPSIKKSEQVLENINKCPNVPKSEQAWKREEKKIINWKKKSIMAQMMHLALFGLVFVIWAFLSSLVPLENSST